MFVWQHLLHRQLRSRFMLLRLPLLLLLLLVLAGCGGHDPVWRMKAQLMLLQLQHEQAEQVLPDDYDSVCSTFQQGERIAVEDGDDEQADRQFVLAYQKGQLLQSELEQLRIRLKEEALQKVIEERAQREEEERARFEAEQQELLEQRAAALKQLKSSKKNGQESGAAVPAPPASYTVRRGETLPQIAARPELYNDAALWPLIYRANRDQIRDPYQLWPGQVLKIPRNFSRDEALDARRLAHRRRL